MGQTKKHYVVTGGAGFIGSHMTDFLLSEGHTVKVLDNLAGGVMENVSPQADFVRFDLSKPESLAPHLKGAFGIFHFAALPRIQPSFADPILHDDVNVRGALHVLSAMREAGVKRFNFSSTSALYGTPDELPTSETAMVRTTNPYALQKFAAEQYALMLAPSWGHRVMSLRYFNAYGPRSFNPKIPANAYSSVIGIFNNAKNTGAKIKITGTGEQRRDFVHAFDIVRANWLAMQSDMASDIFNVGTGKSYSVLEIAKMFADTWEFVAERPGEAAVTLANIAKIKGALDWSPQLPLEAAIAKNLI